MDFRLEQKQPCCFSTEPTNYYSTYFSSTLTTGTHARIEIARRPRCVRGQSLRAAGLDGFALGSFTKVEFRQGIQSFQGDYIWLLLRLLLL